MTRTSKKTFGDEKPGRLPAPPDYLIRKMSKERLAEQIETYKCYVDEDGTPVHLPGAFVSHYYQYRESKVGRVKAVASLPLMRDDGSLLGLENRWNTGQWFDRDSGIAFIIEDRLRAYLLESVAPVEDEDTAAGMVAEAMHFLCDVWLVDVNTGYAGKCVLVALACTVIERMQLDERPRFLVVSGRRGGGKTTTLHMVSAAITGHKAVAAAWSMSHEEQRKAQLAYLREGRPMLVWDNIPRGAVISSPAVARALTSPEYSDRELGVSKSPIAPAFTIQIFNGNNITTAGDLTSRKLEVRLEVDRPDPENRRFTRNQDPAEWTLDHRGEILQALYTILTCNPRRRQKERERSPAPTRFKQWWDLVGSAVEHAAEQHRELALAGLADDAADPARWVQESCRPEAVAFDRMFEAGEREDEQNSAVGQLLLKLRQYFMLAPEPRQEGFTARDVAVFAQTPDDQPAKELRELLDAAAEQSVRRLMREAGSATVQAVAKRLQAVVGNPVVVGGEQLSLRYEPVPDGSSLYAVESKLRLESGTTGS
jgi:hypothetical protein